MKARDVITGVQFLSDQYGGTFRLSENDADAILSALAAAGYVVSRGPSSRSEELLRLLRIPTGRTTRKGAVEVRQVYRGDKTADWYLTYSRDLPEHAPFAQSDVAKLLTAGLIERAYPELDVAFVAKAASPLPTDPEKTR